ncbi:MAG: nucleotidyltransferase family protein [Bryobacteraceae bacterium]
MTPGPSIAAVILSGGASRRMGTPKALLRFHGETFLDRLIRLFSSAASPVIVVVGHHGAVIRSGIERASQAVFAVNPDPERGMLSSLQIGLQAVPAYISAAMFMPVDHPHLEASTLDALVSSFAETRAPVSVPTHAGEHGHPVCITRAVIDQLLALPPEAMASDVIHRYVSQTSYIEVDDAAVVSDIDDPDAYAELIASHPPAVGS